MDFSKSVIGLIVLQYKLQFERRISVIMKETCKTNSICDLFQVKTSKWKILKCCDSHYLIKYSTIIHQVINECLT